MDQIIYFLSLQSKDKFFLKSIRIKFAPKLNNNYKMKPNMITIGKAIGAYAFFLFSFTLLNSCGNDQSKSNLRNQYRNDLESYDGWIGINGFYNLKTGDARSGQHSNQTDSSNIYSISFSKPLIDLSDRPLKKITISTWVKCLSTPANGSYVLSLERSNQTIKYFSFDLNEKDVVVNEWIQVKGSAEIPVAMPKDAVVKIYFWNKSKSVILVDDLDFTIEN